MEWQWTWANPPFFIAVIACIYQKRWCLSVNIGDFGRIYNSGTKTAILELLKMTCLPSAAPSFVNQGHARITKLALGGVYNLWGTLVHPSKMHLERCLKSASANFFFSQVFGTEHWCNWMYSILSNPQQSHFIPAFSSKPNDGSFQQWCLLWSFLSRWLTPVDTKYGPTHARRGVSLFQSQEQREFFFGPFPSSIRSFIIPSSHPRCFKDEGWWFPFLAPEFSRFLLNFLHRKHLRNSGLQLQQEDWIVEFEKGGEPARSEKRLVAAFNPVVFEHYPKNL